MKLLADENIESEIVAALRMAGHQVSDIKENQPGIEDLDVLTTANATEAVLLTNDKDFGELVHREHLSSKGVILLRFGQIAIDERVDLLLGVLKDREIDLIDAFTVITPTGVRIRR